MNMHRIGLRWLPWAGYLCAFAVLEITFGGFFSPTHGVGHDYANAMPQLLDGYYWYLNNGISTPPWFTPAFCAGVPLFADPQWIFYAPLQFFAFFTDPLTAAHLTLLVYSSLGYLGMYLLCRRRLQLSVPSSMFAALLWMLNGFVAHRMIVGHIGFIGISLIPLIAYLLLVTSATRPVRILCISISGILIASWVHSGLGTLLIAAALSVWGLICIAVMRKTSCGAVYLNAMAAALLGLGLSASKLMAAASTMSNLQRTMYPLPGFGSVSDLLLASFSTLMLPGAWAQPIAWPLLKNAQIYLDVHEWTLNLTPIPFVLMLVALIMLGLRARGRALKRPPTTATLHAGMLALILIFPLVVQFYTPGWNDILKSTPLLKSISTPTRWLVLWLPLICAAAAISLDYISRSMASHGRTTAAIGLSAAICVLVYLEPRAFYEHQGYDPQPVIDAYHRAQQPGFTPSIAKLGAYVNAEGAITHPMNRNDLLTRGFSQAFCANPLFGYWLETYQLGDLAPGDMLRTLPSGHLNIKNPACYTFPAENGCKPFDHFRTDQIEEATRFTQYRPWDFKRSGLQVFSDRLTQLTLIGCALMILFSLVRIGLARRRRYPTD